MGAVRGNHPRENENQHATKQDAGGRGQFASSSQGEEHSPEPTWSSLASGAPLPTRPRWSTFAASPRGPREPLQPSDIHEESNIPPAGRTPHWSFHSRGPLQTTAPRQRGPTCHAISEAERALLCTGQVRHALGNACTCEHMCPVQSLKLFCSFISKSGSLFETRRCRRRREERSAAQGPRRRRWTRLRRSMMKPTTWRRATRQKKRSLRRHLSLLWLLSALLCLLLT